METIYLNIKVAALSMTYSDTCRKDIVKSYINAAKTIP